MKTYVSSQEEITTKIRELVQRARMENRLVVRAKQRISQYGARAFNRHNFDTLSLSMPTFVRNNLMKAARRLRLSM